MAKVEVTEPIPAKIHLELSFEEAKELVRVLNEDAVRRANWYLVNTISSLIEGVDKSLRYGIDTLPAV